MGKKHASQYANFGWLLEAFFFNSDFIYIRKQLFVFRFAFMKVHIL